MISLGVYSHKNTSFIVNRKDSQADLRGKFIRLLFDTLLFRCGENALFPSSGREERKETKENRQSANR